jgi:lysophospholipase L1-like esterase
LKERKLSAINRIRKNRDKWSQGAGQALLGVCSTLMVASAEYSVGAIVALVVLNLCLAVALFARSSPGGDWQRRAAHLAWFCSATLAINLFDTWVHPALLLDVRGIELAAVPEVIALALWLASAWPQGSPLKARWRGLALFWLILGEAVWLGVGNFQNQGWLFFGALLVILLTLVLSKRCFRYGLPASQAVNTAILLLAGLPVADVFVRVCWPPPAANGDTRPAIRQPGGQRREINVQNARSFYSFDEAHGNPEAFAAWSGYFTLEFTRAAQEGLYEPMPGHRPPHRLRPGGRAVLLECPISINSRGFRGREIAVPKGAVYRIVCLGESTTFGMTFRKDDKPWPELLEQMIKERLKPARPVEVVNAGAPAWDLSANLERLRPEILPLQPDMIISYHGYNGFTMIDRRLPPPSGPPLPPYPKRPLRLAADLEYRLELRAFMRQFEPEGSGGAPALEPPLQTRYASCYRQLIAFAQTNHIRLALANFCMAIDENSDQRVVNFYSAFGSGILCARTKVNAIHSEIVQRLAEQNPGVCFIDTHPGLEGVHGKFIDFVHFTQEGRQQLAENIFAGIRPQLERDLAETNK